MKYWSYIEGDIFNFLIAKGFTFDSHLDEFPPYKKGSFRFDLKEKKIEGYDPNIHFYAQRHWLQYAFITIDDLKKLITDKDKTQSMKSASTIQLEIYVGDNKALSHAIQSYLFNQGYSWCGNNETQHLDCTGYLLTNPWPGNKNFLSHNPTPYINSNFNPIKINAATEFGKLVDLFVITTIKIKNASNQEYEADFKSNPGYVTFGCAKIDNKIFVDLSKLTQQEHKSGSKLITKIQIGVGVFTNEDIEKIVNHPHFNT